jgi:hypothetical protein
MTLRTMFGEDRLNIALKIGWRGERICGDQSKCEQQQSNGKTSQHQRTLSKAGKTGRQT